MLYGVGSEVTVHSQAITYSAPLKRPPHKALSNDHIPEPLGLKTLCTVSLGMKVVDMPNPVV